MNAARIVWVYLERLRRILREPDVQALLLLAALTIFFLLPGVTMQGVYLYGDAGDSFARLAYGAERLRAGQLPLWDPYLSMGGTHAGDPLALTWYPPTLVLFLLLPEAAAYNYTFVLHYFLAAAGMYLLARSWGFERGGALVAALVFGFSGFAVAHLQHLNILVAMVWLPWIFLCLERFFTTRRAVYVGLGALVLGLQLLGGQMQMVVYGGFAWFAYCAVRWVREWRGGERRFVGKRVLGIVGMALGGVGLAAIFLMPYAELVLFIGRTDRIAYDYVTRFSLEAQRLIAFVYPFFFGGNRGSMERGAGSLIENSAYVGILPLALSVFALTRRDWRVYFLWGLAVVALVLAFGKYSPLFTLFYYVPILGKFDVPARFLGLVVFALALLAGMGLEQLRGKIPSRVQYAVLGGLAVVLVALGVMVALPRTGVQLPVLWADAVRNRALLASIALAVAGIVVLALWLRRVLPEQVRIAATVLVVFAELFYFGANFQYNFVGDYRLFTTPGKSARVILRDRNRSNMVYWDAKEPSLISFLQKGDLGGFEGALRGGIRGSVPLKLKIHSAQGYGNEPMAQARWLQQVKESRAFDTKLAQALALYGAEEILTAAKPSYPNLQLVERNGGISFLRLKDTAQRAFLFRHGIFEESQDSPGSRVIVDQWRTETTIFSFPVDDVFGISLAHLGRAAIVQDLPERVTLDVTLTEEAFAGLNDTFFPGWTVSVDGAPAPLFRANGFVRAASVPAGTHRVEFVYDPLALKIGAVSSVVTLVLVLGVVGWSARRRVLELQGERRTTKVVTTKSV